jgi:hypothetical protein
MCKINKKGWYNTMRENTIKKILEYFTENESTFNECIEELDSYNGYLSDSRYFSMDELNEHFNGQDPIEVLYRAFYGHDADTWTTDNTGNKTYGEFNPNRDYFTYNGYGNLVSSDYKDYTPLLDEYFIQDLIENRYHIDTIDNDIELSLLFDELEDNEK